MRRLLLVLLAVLAAMLPAYAEEPPALINWFKPPAWLADQYPPRANATLMLTGTVGSRGEVARIMLAEDWAAVLRPAGTAIYDYRLRTLVTAGAHGRTFIQPLGLEPMLRLEQLRASTEADTETLCAREAFLGVELPNQPFRSDAHLERSGNSISVVCGGRVVASLELSSSVAAPASLWPTLVNEFDLHPRLAAELSSLKLAPLSISTIEGKGQLETLFSLDEQYAISFPYPMGKGFLARSSDFMDDEVQRLVEEYTFSRVARAKPRQPIDTFPGFLGEMQLRAEVLPALVDRVRETPRDPTVWMDLSDYYLVNDNPFAPLALAAIAYDLPGGPEEPWVKAWVERLREVERQAPYFFLKP